MTAFVKVDTTISGGGGGGRNKRFNLQEAVQEEYSLLSYHLETIEKSIELKEKISHLEQSNYPDLSSFFPQNINDIEIQQFNLNGVIPKRLYSLYQQLSSQAANSSGLQETMNQNEIIAVWILEKRDLLDPVALSHFLLNSLNQHILYAIAIKICSLEIGQHFIEGLKYYLPVCGFWELSFPSHPDYSQEKMLSILEIYVKAHLTSSRKPLLSNTLDH
jgi:hypothetical protein